MTGLRGFRVRGEMCMSVTNLARLSLSVALGLAVGIGGYTFVFARGASYLTDDPAACANCHIMNDYYDGWIKASHHAVAVCNDCHTPAGLIPKYLNKASNGFRHSLAFTTGWFPDPIRIKPHNYAIAEQACQKCHRDMLEAIAGPHAEANRVACIRCHNGVGHL